ncbi:uncharacterized protein LOC102520976 [Camelus ferus]|uniref:Uncharacterized protein LOC102520976 n=1 Tax=Camelus ferus TaxID=419612 RepID=A0A8B6YN69_CAMFR|nr:uncharacterized protein LOC102520976 [Camelus ferus]
MARRYSLRLETRALGAVQILLSLIHCALGVLCDRLFVREEKTQNAGVVPVLVIVVYSLSTAPFFLTSGSMSVSAEKKPIRYKLISASVMNIFSACLSALGTIMLCIACFSFSSEKNEYVWSHLAGSMLLQYLLFSTISELLVTSITIVWIVRALHHPETGEESYSLSESTISS